MNSDSGVKNVWKCYSATLHLLIKGCVFAHLRTFAQSLEQSAGAVDSARKCRTRHSEQGHGGPPILAGTQSADRAQNNGREQKKNLPGATFNPMSATASPGRRKLRPVYAMLCTVKSSCNYLQRSCMESHFEGLESQCWQVNRRGDGWAQGLLSTVHSDKESALIEPNGNNYTNISHWPWSGKLAIKEHTMERNTPRPGGDVNRNQRMYSIGRESLLQWVREVYFCFGTYKAMSTPELRISVLLFGS